MFDTSHQRDVTPEEARALPNEIEVYAGTLKLFHEWSMFHDHFVDVVEDPNCERVYVGQRHYKQMGWVVKKRKETGEEYAIRKMLNGMSPLH